MDTTSRNQRSSIEEPRIGWLFDDSLENADLEEDLSDGTDHAIANCIEDCEPPAPLTSSASVGSQSPSETAIEPENVTPFEKEKFLRNVRTRDTIRARRIDYNTGSCTRN